MLALGLLLFFDVVAHSTFFAGGLRFWPLIVIGVGLELLYGWLMIRRKGLQEHLRLDGRSLALLFMVGVFSVYFYQEAHQIAQNVEPPPKETTLFNVSKKDVVLPEQIVIVPAESKSLILNNPYGKIEVVGSDRDVREIRIEAVAHITAAPEKMTATAAAAMLSPYFTATGEEATLEVRGEEPPGTIDLRVEVPQGLLLALNGEHGDLKLTGYQGDTAIKTKTGAITVEEHAGSLRIENGNGAISMRAVKGAVEVRSGLGGIAATEIDGDVQIFSDAGDCRITEVTGNLNLQANFGKVEIDRVHGAINANTVTGVMYVIDPQGALTASVTNGDVTVDGGVRAQWTLTTTNGKARLLLPKDSNIKFLGETNVGVIKGPTKQSQNTTTKPGAHLTETVGAGTWPVTARSYNGSIFVELK